MGKTQIRIVRNQKSQLVINIPGDVVRHLNLKGGDALLFECLETKHAVISRIIPDEFKQAIGRKVK